MQCFLFYLLQVIWSAKLIGAISYSDYLFKLLLIGDSGVGKSCLLLRFAVSWPDIVSMLAILFQYIILCSCTVFSWSVLAEMSRGFILSSWQIYQMLLSISFHSFSFFPLHVGWLIKGHECTWVNYCVPMNVFLFWFGFHLGRLPSSTDTMQEHFILHSAIRTFKQC